MDLAKGPLDCSLFQRDCYGISGRDGNRVSPPRIDGAVDRVGLALAAAEAAIDNALHTVFSNFFLIAAVIIGLAIIPAFFFYNKRERGESRAGEHARTLHGGVSPGEH